MGACMSVSGGNCFQLFSSFRRSQVGGSVELASEACEVKLRRTQDGHCLREEITARLQSDSYICTICLERVGRSAEVWHCRTCFLITHLPCLKRLYTTSWERYQVPSCPLCRQTIHVVSIQHGCFCGRHRNLQRGRSGGKPQLTPHTCGSPCSKKDCQLFCHPGPCHYLATHSLQMDDLH